MVLFRLILFFIGDGAVQLLQGSDNAAAGLIHGFDTGGSCLCGSHGCDVRDFLTDGCFTQVAVIQCAVCTSGGIDNQVDFAVCNQVGDVGSAFAQLIDELGNNACICQNLLGAFCCEDMEACICKALCHLRQLYRRRKSARCRSWAALSVLPPVP